MSNLHQIKYLVLPSFSVLFTTNKEKNNFYDISTYLKTTILFLPNLMTDNALFINRIPLYTTALPQFFIRLQFLEMVEHENVVLS